MPIYSRRYALWTRLYERMLLEPTPDATITPMVSEVVVPVIDADAVLTTPTNSPTVAGDLSGSPAGEPVHIFTVPRLEEWHLVQLWRGGTSGSTRVVCSIAGNQIPLSGYGTTDVIIDCRNLILRTNDTLSLYSTANGADTARVMAVMYQLVDLST